MENLGVQAWNQHQESDLERNVLQCYHAPVDECQERAKRKSFLLPIVLLSWLLSPSKSVADHSGRAV
jgi:hypothetical protein